MIEEVYVSYEIAKLLKKKGFDEECYWYYPINGGEVQELSLDELNYHRSQFIKAPTHQMAMAWLREVHNIDIVPFHERLPEDCYWARIEKYPYTEYQQEPIYKFYEEAVESALLYTLKNLI